MAKSAGPRRGIARLIGVAEPSALHAVPPRYGPVHDGIRQAEIGKGLAEYQCPVVRVVDILNGGHEQVGCLARASSPAVEQIEAFLVGVERKLYLLIRRVMPPPRVTRAGHGPLGASSSVSPSHSLSKPGTRPGGGSSRPTPQATAGKTCSCLGSSTFTGPPSLPVTATLSS